MGAEFTRTADGVTAAELFRDLAKPTRVGDILTLSSGDSGAKATATIANRSDGEATYKVIVIYANGSQPHLFESYSPEAVVDFVLDKYDGA